MMASGVLLLALMVGASSPATLDVTGIGSTSWTHPAAEGWGGDVWHHYVSGDESVTVLATVWDTTRDAEEFLNAAQLPEWARIECREDAVIVVADRRTEDGSMASREILDLVFAEFGVR